MTMYMYFEALALIVRIQRQEIQLSLMMALKLNESDYVLINFSHVIVHLVHVQ